MKILLQILFLLFMSGCYHVYSYEEKDHIGNITVVDYVNAARANEDFCIKFEKDLAGTIVPEENRLSKLVNALLVDVERDFLKLQSEGYFDNSRHWVLDDSYFQSVVKQKISVNIYSIETPLAASYPSGKMHFSRSLLKSDTIFSVKDDSQIYSLLAHEYIHIKLGHVLYRDIVNSRTQVFVNDKWMYGLTEVFKMTPLGYTKEIATSRKLSECALLGYYFECIADLYTIIMMERAGHDPSLYIDILEGLYRYSKQGNNNQMALQLGQRVYRLREFITFDYRTIPQFLVLQKAGSVDRKAVIINMVKYPIYRRFVAYWSLALGRQVEPVIIENLSNNYNIRQGNQDTICTIFPDLT